MTKKELSLLSRRYLHIFPKLVSGYRVPRHSAYIGRLVQKAIESQSLLENRYRMVPQRLQILDRVGYCIRRSR